jgi:signal transduction histidine kinase
MSLLRGFVFWRAGVSFVRSWLPGVIIAGGIAATVALSVSIKDQELDYVRRTVDSEAEAVSRAIQSAVTWHIQSLLRIAKRWEFRKPSMIEWQDDARIVLEHSYGFEVIDRVDTSYKTQWSVYTGGQKFIDTAAAFDEPREKALEKAQDRQTTILSRAIDLPRKGTGVLIYVPLFTGPEHDRFEGFIAAVLNLSSTMTGLLDVNLLRRYDLEILEGKKLIYTKPGSQDATKNKWAQEADLKLYGVVWFGSLWTIRLWPTPTWLDEMHTSLDEITLLTGLLLTGLLALLSYFFQLARQRAHQLQTANVKLQEEATEREQAQAVLADFMAMIVHDLRSPLSNVINILEMTKEGLFGSLHPDQATWLAKAENTTRNSVDLISDFLDVSRLESGRIELRKEAVDLRHLIKASLENYSLAAQEKTILLKDEIDQSLPRVEADARRLEQVLSNLLSNALKFTPRGGQIVVGAGCKNQHIEIRVKDTGVGIPPDEIGRIFEKYKQTSSGATSEQKGTGLGLVICKMIVEAHGGAIWAESDRGATFTFTLPRRPA